jgi:hypothetical protein
MKTSVVILLAALASALVAIADAQKSTNNSVAPKPPNAETNNAPNSDEQRLLAAIPQLQWTQEYMISNGWLKPGQQVFEKANNFSKKNYGLFGLTGEVSFFFHKRFLNDFSFYIDDGEVGTSKGDAEFAKLYKAVSSICPKSEKRSGDKSSSSIEWAITGSTKKYSVKLTRRVFGERIERGLRIWIDPIK